MQRRPLFILLSVLSVVAIACGTSSPSSNTDSGNRGGAGDSGNAPVGALNQPVRDGKFEFVVSKMDCGKTSLGSNQLGIRAQGVFCLVTVSVKNIGDKPQSFFDANQKGFAGDVEYSTNSSAAMYLDENSVWVAEINPGNTVNGIIVFDIPKGTQLTRLELHDSAFSAGVTVTL